MTLDEVCKIIDEYFRDEFDIRDDPDYSIDVNLFDYGFLDSYGATVIILFLEDRFNIEIDQRDIVLYPMSSVREISTVVFEKVKKD